MDMCLFYSNKLNFDQISYIDFLYLFDPHKTRSQTNCLFTCGRIVI